MFIDATTLSIEAGPLGLSASATLAIVPPTEGSTAYRYSIHTDDARGVALTVTPSCSSESACSVVDELGFD